MLKLKGKNDGLKLVKANLQLFAEKNEGKDVVETQDGVVDRVNGNKLGGDNFDSDNDTGNEFDNADAADEFSAGNFFDDEKDTLDLTGNDAEFDTGSRDPEVAETDKTKQSYNDNVIFQKMRQKAEEEVKRKYQADREALEADKKRLNEQSQQMMRYNIERKHFDAVTPEKITELAYEKGWPEEAAKEVLNNSAKLAAEKEIENAKRNIEMNEIRKESYRNKPYWHEVEKQVDAYINTYPGADIDAAYKFYVGELMVSGKSDEITKKEVQRVQKQTIADIQDRNRRRIISGGDNDNKQTVDPRAILTRQDMKLTNVFGNDPQVVAKIMREQEKLKKRR
jgi:hypothetical protein